MKKTVKKQEIAKAINTLENYYKKHRKPTIRRTSQTKDKEKAFKTLIACLLSLRTKDKNTEIVSKKLFSVADTPKKIANLPIKKLEKLIYSSGFYKNKARTIKSVSEVILKKYKGKVPDTESELLSIKGIGRKTANIVLNFAFNKLALPIDIHCHRIPNRLGWIKTKTPEQTEKELEKILSKKYWREFNSLFVLHGQTICKPRSPLCSKCPINKYCKKVGVLKSR